ncbi:ArsR/SmtB family transcription factor [Undibacterium sp. Ren11W]|uniref:ArsR/SmtB family transcription factor n=1 Tax=Undibacterium sp. Ren11W TaxID=3413045 RepID=UPI003BEF6BFD
MEYPTPFDMAQMRASAKIAVSSLRALANEDRLLLLCQLSLGEKSVSELEQLLDIRQPTLSQQLGVLRTEGLVNTRRDGKRIYYAVADTRVLELLSAMHIAYCPQN